MGEQEMPSFEELFAWAAGEDAPARAKRVAARVRADVQSLAADYLRLSAIAQAKNRVIEAEALAAAARAELVLLQRGKGPAAPVAVRPVVSAGVSRERAPGGPSTADVRAWLRGRGHAVGERGRLSPALWAVYERGVAAGG